MFSGMYLAIAILLGALIVRGVPFGYRGKSPEKTTDEVRGRAWRMARTVAPVTGLLVLAFIAWTHVEAHGGAFLGLIELIGCLAAVAAVREVWEEHEGLAFTATTITIASCIVTIFVDLYPKVMVSSTNPAYSLTVDNAASGAYTLKVMSVIAVVLLPVVLAYRAWTYYAFRRRVSAHQFRRAAPPAPRAPQSPARPPAAQAPQPAAAGSRRGRHRYWRGSH